MHIQIASPANVKSKLHETGDFCFFFFFEKTICFDDNPFTNLICNTAKNWRQTSAMTLTN